MEYIDRDDLLKSAWDKPTLSLSVYDIGNIKPVDVAPVRHGRWLHRKNGVGYCSECEIDAVEDGTEYCPNCGAKMDHTC